MRSFWRDDILTKWMEELTPTCHKPDYLKYVYKANVWLERTSPSNQRPLVPSEMWIDSQKELKAFSIKTDVEDDEEEKTETLRRALVAGIMNKKDWSDARIREIMAARHSTGSSEYLNVIGQKIRHDFLEGVMFQMIKQRMYQNESHYRMHKYIISRCILEVILTQNEVDCPTAGVTNIDETMCSMKDEIRTGLDQWLRSMNLWYDKLVVDDVLSGEL